jgi:hypothetical protein
MQTKFHAPYCKINLHRCGTHSVTMQMIRNSERGVPLAVLKIAQVLYSELKTIHMKEAQRLAEKIIQLL